MKISLDSSNNSEESSALFDVRPQNRVASAYGMLDILDIASVSKWRSAEIQGSAVSPCV